MTRRCQKKAGIGLKHMRLQENRVATKWLIRILQLKKMKRWTESPTVSFLSHKWEDPRLKGRVNPITRVLV